MQIIHSIDIQAPVERVWELTSDLESWPALSPKTMRSVERLDDGELRPDSAARVKQPGQRPKVWTVTAVEPGRRFAWRSRVFGTEVTASHVLTPTDSGTTNTLVLELSGPASPLVGRLFGGQMRKALAHENDGFKRAAER